MIKTDAQLQRDVIDELKFDPSVGQTEIGVAAKDGVITLSGQVDSFARKYSAVRAAERVAGVRAVAEEVSVKLPMSSKRTDTEIAHALSERLRWDIDVPDERVKARVEDGWVWLDGEVDWQYQKNSAERSIRYLTGVKGVTNLVAIRKHASVPDVKSRIENALKRHAERDSDQIKVEAYDGTVTLRGSVGSYAERNEVERAAWSAPGVTKVDDQIAIHF